jgi:hypothetical protein
VAGKPVAPAPMSWSPYLGQMRALHHIFENWKAGDAGANTLVPKEIAESERLRTDPKLNHLDFWWSYAGLVGIPWWAVAAGVLLLLVPTLLSGIILRRLLIEAPRNTP